MAQIKHMVFVICNFILHVSDKKKFSAIMIFLFILVMVLFILVSMLQQAHMFA